MTGSTTAVDGRTPTTTISNGHVYERHVLFDGRPSVKLELFPGVGSSRSSLFAPPPRRSSSATRESSRPWREPGHAHLEGRLEDHEALAHEVLALGLGGQDEFVTKAFAAQMFALRREQGRLGELLDAVRGFVERYPALASLALCARFRLCRA